MKKFFALMLFCSLVSFAFAEVSDGTSSNKLDPAETGYDFIVDGIYYKILETNSVSTSEGEYPYSGKIVIPDEVTFDGVTYKVTKVSGFRNSPDVTEITIPKYTETISSFYGAYSYWQGGPGIKSPNSRVAETENGTGSTAEPSKLTKVFFNAVDCRNAYYSYHSTTMLGGGYDGEQSVFPQTVTDVVFGENVTRIPNGLLIYCPNIKELVFPESVQYIGWKIITTESDKISECKLLCKDLQEIAWLPVDLSCVSLGVNFHTYPCGMEYGVYQDIPSGINYDISKYSTMFHTFIGLNVSGDQPIELPSWVEKIAPNAFQGCKGGLKLELPQSITEIDASTFENCEQLEEITIPSSVKSIGSKAFYGCSNLRKLYFNAENCADMESSHTFAECTSLNEVVFGETVVRIPGYLLMKCTGLTKATIPESVAEIGESAFSGTGLTEIMIPESVISIGEYAFHNCENLTTLYYNAGFCSEVINLFTGCTSLANVNFGETVTKIPSYFLYNCSGLKQINIPNTITEIGESAFSHTGLTSITIPSTITVLGLGAFASCTDLTTVYFNSKNCNASGNVFNGCNSLKYVEFGDEVIKIPASLFAFSSNMERVKISESVIEICEYAFWNSGITEVTIPNDVTVIGESAFGACDRLKTVNFDAVNCDAKSPFRGSVIENLLFGENVEKISSTLAYECNSLVDITIPESVVEIGGRAFSFCNNLTTLNFNAVNCNIVPIDESYNLFWSSPISEVTFGENVEKIPNYILFECSKITQVEIPYSVKEIGDYAFAKTWISNVLIPDLVTKIGEGAFFECPGLTSIVIGSSVEEIGDRAFYSYGENTIKNVSSLNTIPPKMPKDAFFVNIYWNATLSVPTGALTAYQTADAWREFRQFTEVDFTGVEDIEITDSTPLKYYNLQGVEVEKPENGVYIKRQGDKVTKVVIE